MDILVACHKPPGFGHANLFQLNTNSYRRNRTRRNVKPLNHRGDRVYYLDLEPLGASSESGGAAAAAAAAAPAAAPANFFPSWESVPPGSMDIIWTYHCPVYSAFTTPEATKNMLNEARYFVGGPVHRGGGGGGAPAGSGARIMSNAIYDLLIHGTRVLKPGGSIIIFTDKSFSRRRHNLIATENELELLLLLRIINMEIIPDFLYKVDVVDSLTEKHASLMRNTFIVGMNKFNTNLSDYKFLIFTKP